MKKFKNNTATLAVWVGQEIQPGTYYSLTNEEILKWQNDSKVLTDLGSGALIINDGANDILDVALAINFLKDVVLIPKDSDGSPLYRSKITTTGWSYQSHGLEFTTGQLDSIYSKKSDGTAYNFSTIKCYDINGTELTTQGQCDLAATKTVIDWEPTYDYELIGGLIKMTYQPTSDMRLWVVGVPDVPIQYGGNKEFVSNLNLKFVGLEEGLKIEGRAPKYLAYSAIYHSNKIRFIFVCATPGYKHPIHINFEIFKQ